MTWLLLICLIATNVFNHVAHASPGSLPEIRQFQPILDDIKQRFSRYQGKPLIVVSAREQQLYLINENQVKARYTISTAEAGLGNQKGSNKTPLGVHRISHKYGAGAKPGTIFRARGNTGRIAKILTETNERSQADNVTTRIMWLSGLEKGINQGGNVDSHQRYIYIHGTDEEGRLGKPASHGCIRMSNQDVITLFKQAPINTLVTIIE